MRRRYQGASRCPRSHHAGGLRSGRPRLLHWRAVDDDWRSAHVTRRRRQGAVAPHPRCGLPQSPRTGTCGHQAERESWPCQQETRSERSPTEPMKPRQGSLTRVQTLRQPIEGPKARFACRPTVADQAVGRCRCRHRCRRDRIADLFVSAE